MHAAIVLLAIGIAGSSAYQTVREQGLKPGQSMTVAGYTLTYLQLGDAAGGERDRDARDRRRLARRLARDDAAPGQEHVPGREADVERGVDLPRPAQPRRRLPDRRPDRPGSGTLYLKALVKPLVNLIWAAGFLFVFGVARRDVAGRGRAAPARRALRGGRRRGMTARARARRRCSRCSPSLFVARPFLREPAPASDRLDEPGELERRRLELVEERDRALAALKELEFDHRTGKVTDDDYRALVGPLRRRAAEALRALEPRAEARHERIRQALSPAPTAARSLPDGARFCPACGARLDGTRLDRARSTSARETAAYRTVQAEPHWFGVAPPQLLLGIAVVALVFALVLFATGHWPFGLILLGVGALLLAAFLEAARRRPDSRVHAPVVDARERARSALETWRARSVAAAEARQIRNALALLESRAARAAPRARRCRPRRDDGAEAAIRARLDGARRAGGAAPRAVRPDARRGGERIRKARLPVQETMMVPPTEPTTAAGRGHAAAARDRAGAVSAARRGTPPQPAPVPEPGPEPDREIADFRARLGPGAGTTGVSANLSGDGEARRCSCSPLGLRARRAGRSRATTSATRRPPSTRSSRRSTRRSRARRRRSRRSARRSAASRARSRRSRSRSATSRRSSRRSSRTSRSTSGVSTS